jgi:hypothetical protein
MAENLEEYTHEGLHNKWWAFPLNVYGFYISIVQRKYLFWYSQESS